MTWCLTISTSLYNNIKNIKVEWEFGNTGSKILGTNVRNRGPQTVLISVRNRVLPLVIRCLTVAYLTLAHRQN